MNYKKILIKLKKLESEYKILLNELKNHTIIKSDVNNYLKEDKESFKLLWWKYIILLLKFKKLMKASKYRHWIIFFDYNKLVILRYLSILYFNILIDLIKIFWKHETFLRTFLAENFIKDYWYFAKYIYRVRFINLINTPSIFLEALKSKMDKKVYKMLDSEKVYIKNTKRVITDYKNLFFYLKTRLDKIIWVFIQKIWYVIAHTRFSTRKWWLITKKNLDKYLKIAKPGDILLTRWNWNASNLSIPYFWKHMSMYIWNWKYLKNTFQYKFLKKLDDNIEYIIEATWNGVKIVSLSDLISHNDYLWVSRTNFKKEKILRVLKNSFNSIWRGYDHLFNFHSDKNLVCSELIMKSYAKEFSKDEWISINLEKIWISLTYPPNNFVYKLYNASLKNDKNLFPVFFIDSIEKTHKNFISTTDEFIKSRKRPKLSLFLK